MNEQDRNRQFRAMANDFIDLANRLGEQAPREQVGMALLYAASRFNAFLVASHAADLPSFEAERDAAMGFYCDRYRRMLGENLDDHRRFYTEDLRYGHLIKDP